MRRTAAGTSSRFVASSPASTFISPPRKSVVWGSPRRHTAPMETYGPATYGDRIADVYDGWHESRGHEAECGLLRELAGDGPVLELGVGTGRLALPLRSAGV